jgi:hypothetical protein
VSKCRISKYNVVTARGDITYGFRCGAHGIFTRRYSTEELMLQRLKEHKKAAKKSTKKS